MSAQFYMYLSIKYICILVVLISLLAVSRNLILALGNLFCHDHARKTLHLISSNLLTE